MKRILVFYTKWCGPGEDQLTKLYNPTMTDFERMLKLLHLDKEVCKPDIIHISDVLGLIVGMPQMFLPGAAGYSRFDLSILEVDLMNKLVIKHSIFATFADK